jgi:ribonuclease HI
VEVYSDASHKGSGGAWAAVVIRPGRPNFEASGRLKGDIPSSTHAEIKAAANAVHAALKAGLIHAGDEVCVRCDNLAAVRRISGETPKKSKSKAREELAAVTNWIRDFAIAAGFVLTAAWVKGHQRVASACPHAPHNRRADQLCGIAMGIRKPPSPPKPPKRKSGGAAKADARALKMLAAVQVAARLERGGA